LNRFERFLSEGDNLKRRTIKKTYINPTVDIIKVEARQLLTGSMTILYELQDSDPILSPEFDFQIEDNTLDDFDDF
jgi:hypothetical protein